MHLLTKVASSLEKALSRVTYRICNIGVTIIMAMVLLVVTDVILRRFFNSPFPFTLEVVEVMLCVVVFFAVAYTAAQGSHVSIDVLVSRFSPRTQAILNAIMYIISVGLFSFAGWRSIAHGMHLWDMGMSTGVLGIPHYPFVFIIAFGSFLLALVLLARFLNFLAEAMSK